MSYNFYCPRYEKNLKNYLISDGLININIVQDDPLMMPAKNEPEDYYFQDSLFVPPRV